MVFGFTRLEVYAKPLDLVDFVYEVTANFPRSEIYGLAKQLRRASVSVPANIAEGAGRDTAADRRRFYRIARSSLFECVALIQIAQRRSFLPESDADSLLLSADELSRMLSSLMSSLGHLR